MTSSASTPASHANADFGRTRWSLVLAVRSGSESQARGSLADLCRRYWVPVYAYVRRCGHGAEGAAALTQSFLSEVVQHIRQHDPSAAGGFRQFLQEQLELFLASDWTRLEVAAPLDEFAPPWPLPQIEERQRREQPPQASPAQAFERAFALEMLAQALAQLQQEAQEAGRGQLYEALQPYLTRDPGPGEYADLAQRTRSSPLATVVAVKRLRQRYQELIDAQLAQTVGGRSAFEVERQALLAVLAAPSP